MRNRSITAILLLGIVSFICGQETLPNVNNLVKDPISPEATAFTKYGDTPLKMYVGLPEISIPIYTAQAGILQLPISLTYDASGIMVNQVASTVGLGWNLSNGGMISRKTNGLPDQSNGGYTTILEAQDVINSFSNSSSLPMTASNPGELNSWVNMISDYEISNIDLEADTFNFSAPGISGTPGIDYATGKAFCIEAPTLLVNYTMTAGEITKWTVTNAQGIVYEFSRTEKTFGVYTSMENEFQYEYITGWYLSRMSYNNNVIDIGYSSSQPWLTSQHQALSRVRETLFKLICRNSIGRMEQLSYYVTPDNASNPSYK